MKGKVGLQSGPFVGRWSTSAQRSFSGALILDDGDDDDDDYVVKYAGLYEEELNGTGVALPSVTTAIAQETGQRMKFGVAFVHR